MRIVTSTLAIFALLSGTAAADTLPAGGTVDKAVTADIPPNGVDFLLSQGQALLPSQIGLPAFSGSISNFCVFDDLDYNIYEPDPNTQNDGIHVTINNATVTPQNGFFNLSLNATVVGTGTDTSPGDGPSGNAAGELQYRGCGTSCNRDAGSGNDDYAVITFGSTPVSLSTKLYLTLIDDPQNPGQKTVKATTPLAQGDINLSTGNLGASGCSLANFASNFSGFFSGTIKQKLVDEVNNTLLPAVEEGFKSVRYDQDISLAGSTMHVKILPSALDVTTSGVELSMSSVFDAPATTCIPVDPLLGSTLTPGDPPVFGTTSPQGLAFDAAAGISDDFVNQALFAAWHGGLLCHTIDSLGGTPMTVDLLTLAGLTTPLDNLEVAAGTPMLVVIKAFQPPTATFGGAHQISLGLKHLEISIFTQIQERTARLAGLDLDITDAGVDLSVDATNKLNVALGLTGDNVSGAVSYDEVMGAQTTAGLLPLLPILIQQLAPTLQGAIPPIDLGNLAGVTFVSPEFDVQQGAGGVPNDTVSMYTALAPAPGGCAAAGGGCGVGGGTAGCDLASGVSGSALPLWAMALISLGTIARRRRS
jgi:hypothetical protein